MAQDNDIEQFQGVRQWEYMSFQIVGEGFALINPDATRSFVPKIDVMEFLNKLGDDGWELSAVTPGGKEIAFILKRPKQSMANGRKG